MRRVTSPSLWRALGAPSRRGLASATESGAAASSGTTSWSQWFERKKPYLINVMFSGIATTLAMHNVNLRNRNDEVQAELTAQLQASAAARHPARSPQH